jgi:hypothetical protein
VSEDPWRPAEGDLTGATEKNGFGGRIRVILGADETDLPKYDRDGLQKTRDDCARDPKALAQEMLEVRGQSPR